MGAEQAKQEEGDGEEDGQKKHAGEHPGSAAGVPPALMNGVFGGPAHPQHQAGAVDEVVDGDGQIQGGLTDTNGHGGDADAAAFDDVDVDMYLDLVSGEANSIGAVYKAKDDAEAPVDSVRGKEFTIIAITPVLNSPICFNEEAISDDDRTKIIDYFCSDKVANDKAIFIDPEDENAKGLFEKDSEKTCFVKTDDAWYEPIRKLGGAA